MFFDLRKGKEGKCICDEGTNLLQERPPLPWLRPASVPRLWGQTGLMECEEQDWFSEGTGPSALS